MKKNGEQLVILRWNILVRMGLAKSRAIRSIKTFKSSQNEKIQFKIQITNSRRNAFHRSMGTFTSDHSMAYR